MRWPILALLLALMFLSAQVLAQEIYQCSDGLDNDLDGLADLEDTDCMAADDPLEGPCVTDLTPHAIARELIEGPASLTSPLGGGFALTGLIGWPPVEPSEVSQLFKKAVSPIDLIGAGNQLAFWLAEMAGKL